MTPFYISCFVIFFLQKQRKRTAKKKRKCCPEGVKLNPGKMQTIRSSTVPKPIRSPSTRSWSSDQNLSPTVQSWRDCWCPSPCWKPTPQPCLSGGETWAEAEKEDPYKYKGNQLSQGTRKKREEKRMKRKTGKKREKKTESKGTRKKKQNKNRERRRGPREHKKGKRQTKNEIGHRQARQSPSSSSLAFRTK